MNKYNALFLVTILNQEFYRYTYNRARVLENIKNEVIKLPVIPNPNYNEKTKNEELEFIPNWQFMENYIKTLYEPLAQKIETKIEKKDVDLKKDNWKGFKIGKLFKIENCKCSNASELEEGDNIFYLGAKKNDNGIMKIIKYNEDLRSKGNCIVFICDGAGSVGYSNYIDIDFIGSTTLSVGYNSNLNKFIGLFLVSVLDLEREKYSFGRKYRNNLYNTIIKLPAIPNPKYNEKTKNEELEFIPNWQFMENYIKQLAYSDKI